MRAALLAFVAALAVAAAFAPVGSATNECHGIPSCIRVPGPWVIVPAHGTADYLLDVPERPQHRRRARRAGDDPRRPRLVRRPARRAGPAGPDDDALRLLPRRLRVRQKAGVSAAPRLHPDTGRRRPVDGLRTRRSRWAAARVPLAHRGRRARRREVRARLLSADREARRCVACDRVPDEAAAEPRQRGPCQRTPRDRRQEGRGDCLVDRRAFT